MPDAHRPYCDALGEAAVHYLAMLTLAAVLLWC